MKKFKVTGVFKYERTFTEEDIAEASEGSGMMLRFDPQRSKTNAEKAEAMAKEMIGWEHEYGISVSSLDWIVEEGESNKMDFDELRQNVAERKYDNTYPFSLRRKDPIAHREYREEEQRVTEQFRQDCRAAVENELGQSLTDEQFVAVFMKAWADGHSSGYDGIIIRLEDMMYMMRVFLGPKS